MARVEITVTRTEDYCGGAVPTRIMMQELATPKPYVRASFVIIADDKSKKQYAVVTNEEGKIIAELPYGTYRLKNSFQTRKNLLDELKANPYYFVSDEQCILTWQEKGLYTFRCDQPEYSGTFNIHRHCFVPEAMPCISYTGPMPP